MFSSSRIGGSWKDASSSALKKPVQCRGCLRESGCAPLSPSSCLLARRFTQFTSLQISDNDGFPMFLCRECLSALNRAHQFREQCLRSDTFLKSQAKAAKQAPADISTDLLEFGNLTELTANEENIKETDTGTRDDEDDFYVLVVHNDEENVEKVNTTEQPMSTVASTMKTAESYIVENQLESVIGNDAQLMMPDIDYQMTEPVQELTSESINFENEKLKSEFSEIDYSLQVENTDDMNNVRFNLIPLLKDNSELVNNSIIKLEECTTGLNNAEETYTQEEVVVGGAEETYEMVDCTITDFNVESLTKQNNRSIVIKETSFLCNKCGASFHDNAQYEKHVASHDKHTCSTCGKVFDSKYSLRGHMVLHESTDSHLPCPFCKKVLRRNLLTIHVSATHGTNKPTCPICQKTFATEHNRKRHMLIHLDSDYKCDICHITFSHKMAMQNHRLLHENMFELRCQDCYEEFTTEAEMKKHQEEGCQPVSMRKDSKMHICNKCGKIYYSYFSLQTHMEFVHGFEENVLLCAQCGEVFNDKKTMLAHSSTHCVSKYCCKVCGRKCANSNVLRVHERVHTNERPFSCNKCTLSFKTRTHLTSHQLTHTQEKRYGCSVCMKFYSLKGNLIVHLRNHTGERPYVCDICNQAFIDSKYLKKHKMRRHADANW